MPQPRMTPEFLSDLEVAIQQYEEARPTETHVAACLRKLVKIDPWMTFKLLCIRADASETKRWRKHGEYEWETHKPGFFEERLDGGLEPLRDADNKPHECHNCGGVRWVRQINYAPDPAVIVVDRYGTTRSYAQGESYLRRCEMCSAQFAKGRVQG